MSKETRDWLDQLIELAKDHQMSAEEAARQRLSFAFGNTAIENPDITPEMVARAAILLDSQAAREQTNG